MDVVSEVLKLGETRPRSPSCQRLGVQADRLAEIRKESFEPRHPRDLPRHWQVEPELETPVNRTIEQLREGQQQGLRDCFSQGRLAVSMRAGKQDAVPWLQPVSGGPRGAQCFREALSQEVVLLLALLGDHRLDGSTQLALVAFTRRTNQMYEEVTTSHGRQG